MREATVTETCGTCHSLFGAAADGTWTETPTPLADGAEAMTTGVAAYENVGPERQSGHRLGVSLDANQNLSDQIPGSCADAACSAPATLKVMRSLEYGEGDIYDGESVLSKTATRGLYCASCHTPHGSLGSVDINGNGVGDLPVPVNIYNSAGVLTSQAYFGDQLVVDDSASGHPKHVKAQKLISSNPNHLKDRSAAQETYTDSNANGRCDAGESNDELIDNGLCDSYMRVDNPPTSYNNWCLECHNKQWNGTDWEGVPTHGTAGMNNHPPLCVSCHSSSGGNLGVKDFPHTSGNVKLLSKDHDGICLGCHSSGRLP
jgi:hypothetical protein